MAKATNFKFGTQIRYNERYRKMQN